MKRTILILFVFFVLGNISYSQITYSGPADGSVATGVTVTTDSYSKTIESSPRIKLLIHQKYELPDYLEDPTKPTGAEGSNVFNTISKASGTKNIEDSLIVFQNFKGFLHANSIPPDPYLAVGPEHVIQVVNSSFMIYDKEGNILKEISADSWFASALQGVSTFDPKVTYDHFSGRWIQVWLHQNSSSSEGYYLISVSDDDNPLGTWFNWVLPSSTVGDTPDGNWGDYEGVGYDDKAIYLTSNNFSFAGSYDYTKLRIIDKSTLYVDENPGQVTWKDIWNITYPGTNYDCFGLRPARVETASNTFYLAVQSPYTTGTSIGVYKLTDPLGTPTLSGVAIPTVTYSSPPDANQLGGGTPRIDGGGANIRNEPIYKDGKLHVVHAVKNGSYSGIHYIEVDTRANTATEDIVFGDANYYHTYPAMAIDGNGNKYFTFSRSTNDEYMGAFYSVISANTGFPTSDQVLIEGQANYVVTYGGSRNRWGDYNGVWVDPADSNNIWISTEFVNLENKWGVINAGVRAIPFDNATPSVSHKELAFGQVEIGDESNTQEFVIKNYGYEPMEVSSITNSVEDIQLTFDALPITLNAYDSLVVGVRFVPTLDSLYQDVITITNNSSNSTHYINVAAEGFAIQEAYKLQMYASAGRAASGSIVGVNLETGEANIVGPSTYNAARAISVNPNTNKLWGIAGTTTQNAEIVIISAFDGQAFSRFTSAHIFDAMAFDVDGILYATSDEPKLYAIDVDNNTETEVADLPERISAITFNPNTNEMWAALRSLTERDLILKVNVETGDTTRIGNTGLNEVIWGIAFDLDGNLYGVQGLEYSLSKLISINPETAEGTIIGSTGVKGLMGLAFAYDGIVGIGEEENNSIVTEYSLSQNYPNPFSAKGETGNPTTTIKYSLPESTNVELVVFNSIGQIVKTLVKGNQASGNYTVNFDASNLASGIYIYQIKTNNYTDAKKMMLIK